MTLGGPMKSFYCNFDRFDEGKFETRKGCQEVRRRDADVDAEEG